MSTYSTSVPDYRNTSFRHMALTKILGNPDYASLRTLFNEVKSNASSVHTTLGGGGHGHLGLVMTAAQYQAVAPGTPFIVPQHPGDFIPPPNGSGPQIQAAKDRHEVLRKQYDTVVHLRNALTQQIVEAIDNDYLQDFIDENTQQFTVSLADLFQHLFQTYGSVDYDTGLKPQETLVLEYVYDVTSPIDVVYKKIDRLNELSIAANMPYTPQQIMTFALTILKRTNKFSQSIIEWNMKPDQQKTWTTFKVHFRQARKALEQAGALQMQDTKFHTNMIQELKAELKNEVTESVHHALLCYESNDKRQNEENKENEPPAEAANSMSTMKALQDFQKEMLETLKSFANQTNNQDNGNNNRNNKNGRRNNQRNGGNPRKRERKYCWTHGLCAHNGTECTQRMNGHQEQAIVTDRKGGSTRGVPSYLVSSNNGNN